MSRPLPRRVAPNFLGIGGGGALIGMQTDDGDGQGSASPRDAVPGTPAATATVNWADTHDRVFLAGNCWANPIEDWRMGDGAAECQTTGGDRNIHLITYPLPDSNAEFKSSIWVEPLAKSKQESSLGFKIGVRRDINAYRSRDLPPGLFSYPGGCDQRERE